MEEIHSWLTPRSLNKTISFTLSRQCIIYRTSTIPVPKIRAEQTMAILNKKQVPAHYFSGSRNRHEPASDALRVLTSTVRDCHDLKRFLRNDQAPRFLRRHPQSCSRLEGTRSARKMPLRSVTAKKYRTQRRVSRTICTTAAPIHLPSSL